MTTVKKGYLVFNIRTSGLAYKVIKNLAKVGNSR